MPGHFIISLILTHICTSLCSHSLTIKQLQAGTLTKSSRTIHEPHTHKHMHALTTYIHTYKCPLASVYTTPNTGSYTHTRSQAQTLGLKCPHALLLKLLLRSCRNVVSFCHSSELKLDYSYVTGQYFIY